MTLLQPTETPSRTGINNAITSEIANHASVSNTASQHYDSGWIDLPLRANMTASGETPRYRRIGKIVHVRGRLFNALAGGFPAGTTVSVGDLPAGFRPSQVTMWALSGTSATVEGRFWVDTSGIVNVSAGQALPNSSGGAVSLACVLMID